MGVTKAILILQERNDSLRFLNQIRIYDYGHPLTCKDIFTASIKKIKHHCVSALVNYV